MNPGTLKHPIRIERPSEALDDIGQPVPGWVRVGACFARRMKDRAKAAEVISDRDNEASTAVFRVRTRPFIGWYRDGDRMVELARHGFPETPWKITGWAEVEGSYGMYVDIAVVTPDGR